MALIKDKKILALLLLVLIILLIGAVFYSHFEHWRFLDSLYFSVVTLTTVGYGDLAPHTDIGKTFTIVYLLTGVGVLLAFLAIIAENTLYNYRKITQNYLLKSEQDIESFIEKILKR